jgi:hypothetical protein
MLLAQNSINLLGVILLNLFHKPSIPIPPERAMHINIHLEKTPRRNRLIMSLIVGLLEEKMLFDKPTPSTPSNSQSQNLTNPSKRKCLSY